LIKDTKSWSGGTIYKCPWYKKEKLNLIHWDAETIVGATDLALLNRMIETRVSGSSTIEGNPYYKDFLKLVPNPGGCVEVSISDSDKNLLAYYKNESKKYNNKYLGIFEEVIAHIPRSPTYVATCVLIEDGKYIEKTILSYKSQDALYSENEYLHILNPTSYKVLGNNLLIKESLSKEEIDKRDKLRKKES
jgi:hypothetical protein